MNPFRVYAPALISGPKSAISFGSSSRFFVRFLCLAMKFFKSFIAYSGAICWIGIFLRPLEVLVDKIRMLTSSRHVWMDEREIFKISLARNPPQ